MSDPVFVDPQCSLWVSAHAGAGKTRVLIDRVARLLVAGTAPEQILCLTFTKAAAAEMTQRLSASLGALALADDESLTTALGALHVNAPDAALLAQTRRLFARALETPGGLKIQTIHAFCERLLGRFPIEAGVAPGFAVLDDRTAAELLRLAQGEVLSEPADDDFRAALGIVAQLGDGHTLQAMVGGLLAVQRDRSAQDTPGPLEDLRAGIAAQLGLQQGETPATADQAFLDALPLTEMREAAAALTQGGKTDWTHAQRLGAMTATASAARRGQIETYCSVFVTGAGEPRRTLCTQAVRADRPEIETILRAEQQRVQAFIERRKAAAAAERADAALLVGTRIIARYEALKARRAVLDYEDLIAKTKQLFSRGSAAWVLYKLDNGIDHILVDEAQDTNRLQWQVITALADEFFAGEGARKGPRSIFAVGDEKQSIYRFQGADPAIFESMEQYYDEKLHGVGQNLHTPPLHRSWRSAEPVLRLAGSRG